jgi:hypothetical protein
MRVQVRNHVKYAEFPRVGAEFQQNFGVTSLAPTTAFHRQQSSKSTPPQSPKNMRNSLKFSQKQELLNYRPIANTTF